MRNDRLGLSMITATLAVIAIIIAALFVHQGRTHDKQIRAQGIVLARSLSSLPLDQLLAHADKPAILKALVGVQRSADFAYALVVSPAGARLNEVAVPGTLVPEAALPKEPAGWFGDRELATPEDNRRIVEFHAPVLADGALVGFVRVGYFASAGAGGLATEQISFAALLALPVFLLTPLSYFLMRRETQPLAELGRHIQALAQTEDPALVVLPAGLRVNDFAERVGRFLHAIESRVAELESERVESVASSRMLSYKQDRIEAVLQALQDGVMILDASGRPTFANARIEPLLDVAPDQVVGRASYEWCQQPDVAAFMARAQGARGPLEAAVELEGARQLTLSSTPLFSPLDPATLFGTLVVLHDGTQERLTKDAGAQFVANVAHELKTPLNTIASYSEMLMDDSTLSDALRVEAVNVIRDEVERMAALINNMLNISKLETGAMELDSQRVNMRDLLRDSFDSLKQSALGKGLEFRIEVPPNLGLVSLDKGLFRIALNNLLSNAIKYNRAGGLVTLAAEETEDGYVSVSVRDNGIGIAPDQVERIFEKYYRVGGEAAAHSSGHGLGLFLVKQIVELHHGRIAVHSEQGKGTEFSIQIKKQAAPYKEAVPA